MKSRYSMTSLQYLVKGSVILKINVVQRSDTNSHVGFREREKGVLELKEFYIHNMKTCSNTCYIKIL